MSTTVDDGSVVSKDPSDKLVYTFDWGARNLAEDAAIVTSTWAITAEREPTTGTTLAKDNDSILAGLRTTQIRLTDGKVGGRYVVSNTIITNETPAQHKERSIIVLVQQK